MIDPALKSWLNGKDLPEDAAALVVQFDPPDEKVFAGATSRKARIDAMTADVGKRLDSLTQDLEIPKGSVEILGALGTAIIHASPEVLRGLVKPGSPLARAKDVMVRPNVQMPAVG